MLTEIIRTIPDMETGIIGRIPDTERHVQFVVLRTPSHYANETSQIGDNSSEKTAQKPRKTLLVICYEGIAAKWITWKAAFIYSIGIFFKLKNYE